MKEPVDHILRPLLPWRLADETAITECGYDASQVKTLTRQDYFRRLQDMGSQRAALFTCMTCADTAKRWGTWDDDPRRALEREIVWEWGNGYHRAGDDRGTRLRDELIAIAALIQRHRMEFEGLISEDIRRRAWLEKKTALKNRAAPPREHGL